jgi:hypothetical protein
MDEEISHLKQQGIWILDSRDLPMRCNIVLSHEYGGKTSLVIFTNMVDPAFLEQYLDFNPILLIDYIGGRSDHGRSEWAGWFLDSDPTLASEGATGDVDRWRETLRHFEGGRDHKEVVELDRSLERTTLSASAAIENVASQQSSTDPGSDERVYTLIRGHHVDITGLGLDNDFLEALPEDMREEVIDQHIRDRRAAAPPNRPSGIDRSILEILSPDVRDEHLEEEVSEKDEEYAAQGELTSTADGTDGENGFDPAVFIASLEGPLREAVLLDQDDDMLAQLPPDIVAEARALRDRVGRHFG